MASEILTSLFKVESGLGADVVHLVRLKSRLDGQELLFKIETESADFCEVLQKIDFLKRLVKDEKEEGYKYVPETKVFEIPDLENFEIVQAELLSNDDDLVLAG